MSDFLQPHRLQSTSPLEPNSLLCLCYSPGRNTRVGIHFLLQGIYISPVAQVQFLGLKDPLEEAWQSTPGFLTGESHGQRSLVGFSTQGHKESNMTEAAEHTPKYVCVCVCVSSNIIDPTPFCSLGFHTFVLHICVSIAVLQIRSSIPFFLDCTYMH